jgi:hypothetical protein
LRKRTKKYRLFALAYSLDNVEFASSFRFSRVTPEYILIYAQRAKLDPPDGKAAEVKENDISRLSKMDEAWLFDCGVSLFADIAARQSKEDLDRLTDMVDRLEEELRAESGKEESAREPDGRPA